MVVENYKGLEKLDWVMDIRKRLEKGKVEGYILCPGCKGLGCKNCFGNGFVTKKAKN